MIHFREIFSKKESPEQAPDETVADPAVEPRAGGESEPTGLEGLGRPTMEAERTEILRKAVPPAEGTDIEPEQEPEAAEFEGIPVDLPPPRAEPEATRTAVHEPMGPGSAEAPWMTSPPEPTAEAPVEGHVSEDSEVDLPDDPFAFMEEAMNGVDVGEEPPAEKATEDHDTEIVEAEVVVEATGPVVRAATPEPEPAPEPEPVVLLEPEIVEPPPSMPMPAAEAPPGPVAEASPELAGKPQVDTRALKAAMGEAGATMEGGEVKPRSSRPKTSSIPRDVSAALDDLISGGMASRKDPARRVGRILEEERTEAATRPGDPAPAASAPTPQAAAPAAEAREDGGDGGDGDWELSLDEVLKRYSSDS